MGIAGIVGSFGMYNPTSSATKTTKAGEEVEFSKNAMKCVSAGGQSTMLCSDALMSYASPQTGESVNIYKSDSYSEDNPVYASYLSYDKWIQSILSYASKFEK